MKPESTSLLQLASQRLSYLTQAQVVATRNVANADTPGYRAQSVEAFDSFLGRAQHGESAQADVRKTSRDNVWERGMNGNTVSLVQEQLEVENIRSSHKLAATIFQQSYAMLSLVATKP